jgi:hypothetical protein
VCRPDSGRVGVDGGVDQQTFEWVIEVPVVVQMLVIPDDLTGVGVEGERRVVVQMRVVRTAHQELRRRRGDRRADVE